MSDSYITGQMRRDDTERHRPPTAKEVAAHRAKHMPLALGILPEIMASLDKMAKGHYEYYRKIDRAVCTIRYDRERWPLVKGLSQAILKEVVVKEALAHFKVTKERMSARVTISTRDGSGGEAFGAEVDVWLTFTPPLT